MMKTICTSRIVCCESTSPLCRQKTIWTPPAQSLTQGKTLKSFFDVPGRSFDRSWSFSVLPLSTPFSFHYHFSGITIRPLLSLLFPNIFPIISFFIYFFLILGRLPSLLGKNYIKNIRRNNRKIGIIKNRNNRILE